MSKQATDVVRLTEVLTAHSEEWGDPNGDWRCGCGAPLGRANDDFETRQREHQAEAVERIVADRIAAARAEECVRVACAIEETAFALMAAQDDAGTALTAAVLQRAANIARALPAREEAGRG